DITAIDAQQWQFAVPTPQPTNVGQPYGNDVIAPLEAAIVSIVALPAVSTTTLPEITTTTLPEITTTTLPGATTTTFPGLTTTTISTTTTTSTTLPNPAPPSAANVTTATDQDTAVDVTLSGADLNDCELTFSIVTPPAHGTLGPITNHACSLGLPSSDTATATYTPAAGFHGSDAFTYQVNDGATATRFTYGRGESSSMSLRLRPGPDGKAEIVARGTGVALDLSPLPAGQPVTVQLKNNEGKCWEATYSAPANANGPGKFVDRSD